MKYPKFFDKIETIKLKDDLSEFLGTFEDGIVEFSYLDVVKSAGHSCPTVSGAYLMTLEGLKALYGQEVPKRGEIFISFKEDINDGVAGVIANVMTQITGATATTGFKGLGGEKFARTNLMEFNSDIKSNVKFKRVDTGKTVEVLYDPSSIEGESFQQKVENIFNNIDKVITIKKG